MPMNRVEFQPGLSLTAFMNRFGSEAQCADYLAACRWPEGFRCPRCSDPEHYRVYQQGRSLFRCRACRHQTSLTAGTVMDSTKLPLKCSLGVNYRTAWLIHHEFMAAMAQADEAQPLRGDVQIDDAYLGGERPGTGGRGSENKVPFVAAVSPNDAGHPLQVKLGQLSGFTRQAAANWARTNLTPGCNVTSDGLACFAGVIDAGCSHAWVVVGQRKPRELQQFTWVNTILGNLKTSIGAAHKACNFAKYAPSYFGDFAYRFNHRFNLRAMV